MFFESAKAETTNPHPVSTEQIQIPLAWITGSTLAIFAMFFSVVWWVRGVKGAVDDSKKRLDQFERKMELCQAAENRQRIEVRDELRLDLKRDIAESASNICHGFELFAVEIRQNIKILSEKIEARDATVNRLSKKVDYLSEEMFGISRQLSDQGIKVHHRRSPHEQLFGEDD